MEEFRSLKVQYPLTLSKLENSQKRIAMMKTRRKRTEVVVPSDLFIPDMNCRKTEESYIFHHSIADGHLFIDNIENIQEKLDETASREICDENATTRSLENFGVVEDHKSDYCERQTVQQCDALSVSKPKLPTLVKQTKFSDFSVEWSEKLMSRYTEQNGPNCAAAVVAGLRVFVFV
jgi:hypothetical protein